MTDPKESKSLQTPGPTGLLIMIPVFNDWDSVRLLLPRVGAVLKRLPVCSQILLVDDASTHRCPADMWENSLEAISQVRILSLRRNLGHQRALAIGLAYAEQHVSCQAVLIMDGDGEDNPDDIPRLYERMKSEGNAKVVFAERTKRSENWVFRTFYRIFRIVHYLLTGFHVRVGNFSIVPYPLLRRIVVLSELWNHYAAAVFKSRMPYDTVPTQRAKRLMGTSQMNFVGLVVHGLSALSVYSEIVGVRLLLASVFLVVLVTGLLAGIIGIRLASSLANPGWASTVGGLIVVILIQVLGLASSFVFLILQGRGNTSFLPVRDYAFFVDQAHDVYPKQLVCKSL
ncbi:MAG: glycosyltransferase [Gemmataceae bacterium]